MKQIFSWLLLPKNQFFSLIISTGLIFTSTQSALTQPEILPIQPNGETVNASEKGLYFADILVRGRP